MGGSTRTKAYLMAIVLGALAATASSTEPSAPVTDATLAGKPLVLQGTAVRSKFFVDVYSLALFTERRFSDGESLIAANGPRRAQLTFLRDVDRARGEAAWREAIEQAIDADERQSLAADIARFAQLFPAVKQGDVIVLDDVPGRGLSLRHNGTTLARIDNPALFRAILKVWVGPRPIQSRLKQDLLR